MIAWIQRFIVTAPSRFLTLTACQPSRNLFSVCHKALSLARYCFCCIQLSFLTSSHRPDWVVSVTLTRRRCTLVLQLRQCHHVACMEAIDAWMRSNDSRWTSTRLSRYSSVPNNSLTSFQSPSYLWCPPGWQTDTWVMLSTCLSLARRWEE